MDFAFSEEQELFRSTVRKFAERELAPHYQRHVAASITNREALAVAAGLAFVQLAGIAPSLWGRKAGVTMPAKSSQTGSGGFTAAERAAMKQRAAELRAEGKKGAKKADGLQAVLDSIAKMAPEDRAVAERVHATVSATAPKLSPKTWYGMPAYANADGKVVVCFKNSGKFNTRYSTLEVQDAANLDDGAVARIVRAARVEP